MYTGKKINYLSVFYIYKALQQNEFKLPSKYIMKLHQPSKPIHCGRLIVTIKLQSTIDISQLYYYQFDFYETIISIPMKNNKI